MKTKKKSGKNLRKSGKSQGKIREFDGIKKVRTLDFAKYFWKIWRLFRLLGIMDEFLVCISAVVVVVVLYDFMRNIIIRF